MIFPVDIAVANLYSIEAELIPRQAIKQALDWGSGETLTSPDPILSGRAKLSEHSDISASARDQAKAKSETPADSLSIAQTKAFPICPACGEETNPRPIEESFVIQVLEDWSTWRSFAVAEMPESFSLKFWRSRRSSETRDAQTSKGQVPCSPLEDKNLLGGWAFGDVVAVYGRVSPSRRCW